MKKIVIGVASQDAIRARARSIASGEHKPASDEPKIWFTSMRSLAEVLSDDNRALLKLIRDEQPESLNRLAELSGRAPGNLSRILKTMESATGWLSCADRRGLCGRSPRPASS